MASNTAPLSQVRDWDATLGAGQESCQDSIPSLDWLDVSSDHIGPVPVFCSVISDHTETDTGTCFRTWKGQEQRGSWASSLMVRSDGRKVRISGNPSRWGHPENLGGCDRLEDALRVFDAVLIKLGLPPVRSNATIHRMDWCQNLSVGSGQERAFLRWASGQVMRGKHGHLYPDGLTCEYRGRRGSRKVYVKYYAKGPELRYHGGRRCSDEQKAWRERCAQWCDSEGVVRHEVTIRADWLARRGWSTVREWCTGADARKVVQMYAAHERPQAAADPFGDVISKLVDLGYSTATARQAEIRVRAWSTGLDLRATMSRSAFYRVRAPLLRLGWDIATAFDVSRAVASVRVLCVRPVSVPEWYSEREGLREAV